MESKSTAKVSSSAINDWKELADCQRVESMKNESALRQLEADRRRKYKEELDFLVRLKNQGKENNQSRHNRHESNTAVDECLKQELKEESFLRQLQRQHFLESLEQQELQKRKRAEGEAQERQQQQKHLEDNQSQLISEQRNKFMNRQHQVQQCREHYNMQMERKRQAQDEQNLLEKQYFEKEREMLTKMEVENFQFMDHIRHKKRPYEGVFDCYAHLNEQERKKKEQLDGLFVNHGYLQNERKAQERAALENEKLRERKRDISETLKGQIEHKRLKKEAVELENLRKESEMLKRELEAARGMEERQRLARQATVKSMIAVLDKQIAERQAQMNSGNILTTTEEEINCYEVRPDGLVVCPEKTVESIPGFVAQEDRKRMLRIQEQSSKLTEKQMHNEMILRATSQNRLTPKNTRRATILREISQQQLKAADYTSAVHGKNSESEYQLIRWKNNHKNFDIISNRLHC